MQKSGNISGENENDAERGAALEAGCTEAAASCSSAEEIWEREDADCAQGVSLRTLRIRLRRITKAPRIIDIQVGWNLELDSE